MEGPSIMRWLMQAAAFGLVAAVWGACMLWWWRGRKQRQAMLQQRLEGAAPQTKATSTRTLRLWHEGKEATTIVREDGGNPNFRERLEQLRLDAGFGATLRTLLLQLLLAAVVLGFALVVTTGRVMPAIVAVAAVLIFAW